MPREAPRLVVLTGGPGAGKTAVLEVVRRQLGEEVVVLPEAASILWTGGFPRRPEASARRAAQRAIARVQRELEAMALEDGRARAVLCDRGTVDGEAYWPGDPAEMWAELGTTREAELRRYAAVIHMRSPAGAHGYNHSNPVRTESAAEAREIDRRLEIAWAGHPHRRFVECQEDFMSKLDATMRAIGLALTLAATACAARAPHTYAEQMSAQEHRREAVQHFARADEARRAAESRDHGRLHSYSYRWDVDRWLEEEEGEQHLSAAMALEREYAFACALIEPEAQERSPFDGLVLRVDRDGDDAVVLHLAAGAGPPAPLLHRLRCHRARMALYGLAEGASGPAGC